MTKKNLKELIKKLTLEVLSEEDITGTDDAAVVQSDKLTATLSEDNAEDIKDLEKLLKNPDPSRAKDYGSIENYKKMLQQKIARLKGQKNESGDPFRDIVKKYADLYRASEMSRQDKEDYFRWLQTHQPEKFKKLTNKLKKK